MPIGKCVRIFVSARARVRFSGVFVDACVRGHYMIVWLMIERWSSGKGLRGPLNGNRNTISKCSTDLYKLIDFSY